MASAVAFRADFTGAGLRALARSSRDANQVRRLLALAAIYEGGARSDAAQLGGVGLQTVRGWVLRLNAAGPDGLIDAPPPGVPLLDDTQRRALAQIVESGPIPASHGAVRWRLIDLAQWVWDEFEIAISKQALSRELRAMGGAAQGSGDAKHRWNGCGGYRKLSARPRHQAHNDDSIPTFKNFPAQLAATRARRRSEVA
jgi:transposase